MSEENKRTFGDREEEEAIQEREEMLKRFEGKKLLQWTEEQKKEWIASPSCSSLLADSFLFACKQVLGSIYESQVERSHIWNTDLLCQKWHMRNQEIGMIISLTDPDIYYCDIDEFDDWGIRYISMPITSSIPTEEELLKILQLLFQFHQKNPSLLVGIMDMTLYNLPYFIIAQYLLRTKKATIHELDSLLTLSKNIPNANLLAQLRSFNVHSTNWIQRFHSFTRHSPCLPMKIDSPLSTLPSEGESMCSWLPRGERVFFYVENGNGVLIKTENGVNSVRCILPQTFMDAKNHPHNHTLCDGILVNEKKAESSHSTSFASGCIVH